MPDTVPIDDVRALMAIALAGLLLLLRLDAFRFGAAEFDTEPTRDGGGSAFLRVSWPVLAVALTAGVGVLLPAGLPAIGFGSDGAAVMIWAVCGAAIGIGAVLCVAYLRDPVWPPRRRSPDGSARLALDAVGTAVVDELTFRGVLLGLLLLAGVPPIAAFTLQLLAYGLETRLGRSRATVALLAEALALGALMGVLVLVSGSVLAPLLAHAAIRFAALDVEGGVPPLLPPRLA